MQLVDYRPSKLSCLDVAQCLNSSFDKAVCMESSQNRTSRRVTGSMNDGCSEFRRIAFKAQESASHSVDPLHPDESTRLNVADESIHC
ncbi:unnamed protein product, partial [Dicrocoelium dendriticum]